MSNRSARVRFTCQDSKGHVVMSMLVPDDLLENYNRSCQEFVGAEAALPNSPTDRQPYFNVLRKFQAETNQLTHSLWTRQTQSGARIELIKQHSISSSKCAADRLR